MERNTARAGQRAARHRMANAARCGGTRLHPFHFATRSCGRRGAGAFERRVVADCRHRVGGVADGLCQGGDDDKGSTTRMIRRFVTGSAVVALALAAGAWGGQASPQAAPAPVATSASSPLPTTQALFDGYVRDNKMFGFVGFFCFVGRPTTK